MSSVDRRQCEWSMGGIGGGVGGFALWFGDDRSDSSDDEVGFQRLQQHIKAFKKHRDSKTGVAHAAGPGGEDA